MNGGGPCKDLIQEAHGTTLDGHLGVKWMLALLSTVYFLQKVEDDIESYVKTCLVCEVDKTQHKKEPSLLSPFPIPEPPWLSVSMYFILGFLKKLMVWHL